MFCYCLLIFSQVFCFQIRCDTRFSFVAAQTVRAGGRLAFRQLIRMWWCPVNDLSAQTLGDSQRKGQGCGMRGALSTECVNDISLFMFAEVSQCNEKFFTCFFGVEKSEILRSSLNPSLFVGGEWAYVLWFTKEESRVASLLFLLVSQWTKRCVFSEPSVVLCVGLDKYDAHQPAICASSWSHYDSPYLINHYITHARQHSQCQYTIILCLFTRCTRWCAAV